MDKFYEKKNLGLPLSLLTILAYFIGYYMSIDYGGFLVGLIFAVVVFALDFDDKVKTAVKQSYTIAFVFCLIYLGLRVIYQLSNLTSAIYILNKIFSNIYNYATYFFNIVVIVVFAFFVILALIKKDMKLDFIVGEGAPKQKPAQQPAAPMYQQMPPQQPMYQQQVPPMQQQMPQQPMPQQPYQAPQPHAAEPPKCPKCGTVNHPGAAFCASCGNKLN